MLYLTIFNAWIRPDTHRAISPTISLVIPAFCPYFVRNLINYGEKEKKSGNRQRYRWRYRSVCVGPKTEDEVDLK